MVQLPGRAVVRSSADERFQSIEVDSVRPEFPEPTRAAIGVKRQPHHRHARSRAQTQSQPQARECRRFQASPAPSGLSRSSRDSFAFIQMYGRILCPRRSRLTALDVARVGACHAHRVEAVRSCSTARGEVP